MLFFGAGFLFAEESPREGKTVIVYSKAEEKEYTEILRFVAENFPTQMVQHPLLRPRYECFHIAREEVGGRLVGLCGFDRYGDKIGEIRWLGSILEGRGIGSELLRLCIEDAVSSGVYQILAITNKKKERLFAKFGFETSPDNCEALVWMRNGHPLVEMAIDPRIREATKHDREGINRIIANFPWLVQDENLRPSLENYFVAEEQGAIVGCCGVQVYGPKMAEIFSLAVLPGYQDREYLEEQMLFPCMRFAERTGVYQILSITHPDQKNLLEQYGFGAYFEEKVALIKTL